MRRRKRRRSSLRLRSALERGEQLRALLALMVLGVAVRILIDLVARPADLYSIIPATGG